MKLKIKTAMGLFTSLFKGTPTVLEFKPQTIQEAYISVLYPVARADGDFGEEELTHLASILSQIGIFESSDVTELIRAAYVNIEKYGAKQMIEKGLTIINDKVKPRLFCFCADIIFADGVVTEEEEKTLEHLSSLCQIDEETAKKIIEVSMIRAGIN